ncbi:MAG: ribose-phosphate pyrophosphokinase [bacterium]
MSMPEQEFTIKPTHDIKIFSGRSHTDLAQSIARYLGTSVGPMQIKNFSDGEIYVKIQESIRGDDVFIVQPISDPVNENLMELLLMIDAFKRASAKSVTAVIPYYAYARQDRKASGREAISAKLIADLLTTSGATRVLAMDLHTGQLQGFFNIPVDHIYSAPAIINYIKSKNLDNIVAVSPDAGGVERTRYYAKKLDCPIAIIDKRRKAHNEAKVEHLIGSVEGKTAIIFDDIIDTAGTITEGAKVLLKEGAKEVYICATHAVFSGPALQRLEDSPAKEIIITNTLPLKEGASSKITQLNIAYLLGEAITRIHDDESVSSLFE